MNPVYETIKERMCEIHDFTVDGKCSKCGECCSNILPVSDMEIRRIKQYIAKHKIKENIHFIPLAGDVVDGICPFLDNATHKCAIYSIRPAICRDFQCDKFAKGVKPNWKLYAGKYKAINVRETFFPNN